MFFYTFIPKLLNMSLTASVAIVFVLLLRLLLKQAPKVISYALWSVVLFRLLCPVSIESNLSLFGLFGTPTVESSSVTSTIAYVPTDIVHTEYPAVVLPVPGIGDAINDTLPQGEEQLVADPMEVPMAIATYVWMAGVLVMAVYSAVTYVRLRRRLLTASPLRDNIYLVDEITSPFVMGLFRPKIYLPSAMEEREQSYIILHEQHHIRRLDHIIKALAFVALCIHWFNPLVWLAFILSGKDMEMSCDEAVVKKMGDGVLADYTASLLSLATGKRIIAGMPLAFGEGDTKGRIKNLANWRKPAFWVILLAVIACVVLAVCLLTNPSDEGQHAPEPFSHSYRVERILYDDPRFSFVYVAELAPRYSFTSDYQLFVSGDISNGLDSTDWVQQSGAFKEVLLSGLIFDDYFKDSENLSGWDGARYGPESIRENTKQAWRFDVEDSENSVFYYLILTHTDKVYLCYGYDVGDSHAAAEDGSLIRWVFELARIDLLSCNAISEDSNAYIEPAYYPEGFNWEYDNVTEGEINDGGTLVFTADWETDTLVVSEDYYRKNGTEATTIEKETYELTRNSEGKFELDVSRRGETQEEAFYFIQGETGVYVMKIIFNNSTAPLVGTGLSAGDIVPGTTYVSYQCIYMNPLSSYAAFGGDSGCKYIVGEDYFATVNRNDGSTISVEGQPNLDTAGGGLQNMVDVPKWEWQEFPYSDGEWAALYRPEGFGMQNISEIYDEILYQPLIAGKFLLRVDGDMWLVELKSNEQMGTYLWSIYSLVPESAMGVAQWEHAPMLSSRSPVFRFEFDMEYMEVSAVCTESPLVDFDTDGAPSDTGMVFRQGNALCWSPVDEDGNIVPEATIHFTVHDEDVTAYHGTIYIESTGGSGGRTVYTASLVGTGLHLAPNTEREGGVISAAETGADFDAVSAVKQPAVEYDLRSGELEIPVDAVDRYVFFTNSTRIAVDVQRDSDFSGSITLLDISQGNAEILFASVDSDDNDALFTGLTASRLYCLTCEGLDGCTLVISG